MKTKIETGILLLDWNNEENVQKHIEAAAQWKKLTLIVVVDNASEHSFPCTRTTEQHEITLIRNDTNRGFSGGNNVGFQHMISEGCEFILLLNHDAHISEEIVIELEEVIKNDHTIGVIGPCTREGSRWYAGGRNIAHHPNTRIPYNENGPRLRIVDYIPGAVSMIRVSALKEAGFFDEKYFFSGEMADLCQRIRNCGYTCVIHTGMGITHDIEEESPMRERIHTYYSVRNRFLYIRKNEPNVFPWTLFWVIYASGLVIASILRNKPHSARAILLAVNDGLRGKFGDHNEYFMS